MNNSAGRKLKSQSGASLVLAILVFLICALVGSTILAAASSSGGTVMSTWEDDRQVYVLKSASNAFTEAFKDKSFTVNGRTLDVNGKLAIPSATTLDTLYEALSCKTYNVESASQKLQFSVGDTSLSIDPVTADITMDNSYNVTAIFTMSTSSRKVKVYISAATASADSTQGKADDVRWQDPVTTVQ